MKQIPPIGVIGPIIVLLIPIKSPIAKRYKDPENKRIPHIKQLAAHLKYFELYLSKRIAEINKAKT